MVGRDFANVYFEYILDLNSYKRIIGTCRDSYAFILYCFHNDRRRENNRQRTAPAIVLGYNTYMFVFINMYKYLVTLNFGNYTIAINEACISAIFFNYLSTSAVPKNSADSWQHYTSYSQQMLYVHLVISGDTLYGLACPRMIKAVGYHNVTRHKLLQCFYIKKSMSLLTDNDVIMMPNNCYHNFIIIFWFLHYDLMFYFKYIYPGLNTIYRTHNTTFFCLKHGLL
ncbi:hypothetical protein O3G_MSEX011731 [Manduca sexta]|uniref:Uncharacterized protein n=1 Tax=Manduca sexta TaxID=7130 RepID=A0A921ZM11_MANSE|nr:hypothetical protein O3G_MSEX011731 [Manduca sexta]KAG6460030.1 hypothetical protein O3G_MSEX011731 [Manduca sexta]KAG6460031.1 hypothetical protein O3G_MSEX011731 [Manduca sexta]